MPPTRRWTLNEKHGYYVMTGITEPRFNLELSFKRLNGAVERVGVFRLNLVELSGRGVVTSRMTPEGEVFDVKIVRDARNTYHLAVREAESLPLETLRAR